MNKNIINSKSSNLASILFFIIGIILILYPKISIALISYSIAFILIISGIIQLANKENDNFIIGALKLILGIVIMISPNTLTYIIQIILGIWFILSGILKLNSYPQYKDNKNIKIVALILAIIPIVCGIIMLMKTTIIAVTILIGILLIIYSICDIANTIIIKKNN